MLRQMCINYRARFRYLLRSLFWYKIFWGACISGIWTVLNVKVDFAARWENCKSTLSLTTCQWERWKVFKRAAVSDFRAAETMLERGWKKTQFLLLSQRVWPELSENIFFPWSTLLNRSITLLNQSPFQIFILSVSVKLFIRIIAEIHIFHQPQSKTAAPDSFKTLSSKVFSNWNH